MNNEHSRTMITSQSGCWQVTHGGIMPPPSNGATAQPTHRYASRENDCKHIKHKTMTAETSSAFSKGLVTMQRLRCNHFCLYRFDNIDAKNYDGLLVQMLTPEFATICPKAGFCTKFNGDLRLIFISMYLLAHQVPATIFVYL